MEGTLDRTLDSCMNYWLEVLKDDQERASIKTIANELADLHNNSAESDDGISADDHVTTNVKRALCLCM